MTRATSFLAARAWPRRAALVLLAALLPVLAGCAGFNKNPRDPLEPMNRKVMEFNDGVDALVLKPAATVYKNSVHPLVRTGVSNFFGNLGDGWNFINSALQLKFHNAAENILRLNVNTFFGLGGILDIASELNIERHKEDFGQTLGRWGVPAGPYIVLPLLGPSTLRDTLVLPIERMGDPLHQLNSAEARNALYVLRAVDGRSNLLRLGSLIEGAALDKYSFTRDAHLQRRRAEILEGKESESEGAEPKADGSPAPSAAPVAPGQPASAPAR